MSHDRRNFLRKGGILGAIFAGAAAPVAAKKIKEVEKKPAIDPEVKRQIEEFANTGIIELHKTYGVIKHENTPQSSNILFFHKDPNIVPGTEKQVKLGIAVGPDGEFYVRVNGDWKKVLTT